METVRTEHPKRIAAQASVRPTSDFTLNRKTESPPTRQQVGEKTAPKKRGVHWRAHNFNFGLVPHPSVVRGSLATFASIFPVTRCG